jgi:hypothetical protein
MGWIGSDAGKPQEFEQTFEALRELLINLCENRFRMGQDFTRWRLRRNRLHSVTAFALTARGAP